MDTVDRIIHAVLLRMSIVHTFDLHNADVYIGVFSGKMVDNLGSRWPLLLGSFLHIFGLMMTSISDKYYEIFLAQSVCSAIGTSFLFCSSEQIRALVVVKPTANSAQLLLRQGLDSSDTERSRSV
jgi:hypothetical protein